MPMTVEVSTTIELYACSRLESEMLKDLGLSLSASSGLPVR